MWFFSIKRNPITGKYEGLQNEFQPEMSKEAATTGAIASFVFVIFSLLMFKRANTPSKKLFWGWSMVSNLIGAGINAEVARTLHKEDEEISQFEEGWLAHS